LLRRNMIGRCGTNQGSRALMMFHPGWTARCGGISDGGINNAITLGKSPERPQAGRANSVSRSWKLSGCAGNDKVAGELVRPRSVGASSFCIRSEFPFAVSERDPLKLT
jgi:hypothetical protein